MSEKNKLLEQAFCNIVLQREDYWVHNFMTAVHRGSLMRLDNLGIVIDVKNALINYARYIDKDLDDFDHVDRTVAVGFEAWRVLMDYGIRSSHGPTLGDVFPKNCSECGGTGELPERGLICVKCYGTGKERARMFKVYYSYPIKPSWKYWFTLIQAHSEEEAIKIFKESRNTQWHATIKIHGVGEPHEAPPVTWKSKRKSLEELLKR